MKNMKSIIVILIMFFLVGCSTISNLKLVDPAGRELPNPHYVLRSLSNGMTATFYYVAMSEQKDIDGTIISRPTYISMTKIYKAKPTTKLLLVIEISNPKKVHYKLWSKSHTRFWKKIRGRHERIFAGSLLAESRLEYRQFLIDMPVNRKIKDVTFGAQLYGEDGIVLMYFGDFHYQIKK